MSFKIVANGLKQSARGETEKEIYGYDNDCDYVISTTVRAQQPADFLMTLFNCE